MRTVHRSRAPQGDQRTRNHRAARSIRSLLAFLPALLMPLAVSSFHAAPNEPAPVLLGETSARRILKIAPEWRSGYDAYSPDPATIEKLREAAQALQPGLEVTVIYGSWCGDSRDQVPRFLRVQKLVGGRLLPSTFLAISRDKKTPAEAVEGRDIVKVPTFIVTFKGLEMGRIIETPKISIEADLLEILSHPS
jgi:thiol-disulfide isomerase/thioredoxin